MKTNCLFFTFSYLRWRYILIAVRFLQYKPLIDPRNTDLVHHITLNACKDLPKEKILQGFYGKLHWLLIIWFFLYGHFEAILFQKMTVYYFRVRAGRKHGLDEPLSKSAGWMGCWRNGLSEKCENECIASNIFPAQGGDYGEDTGVIIIMQLQA